MRRHVLMGMVALVGVGGCGRAPEDGASEVATNATDLAFTYAYRFRLPSDRIGAAQDAHATACERIAPRCRITGMTYHVDSAGVANASLDVALAAPIARRFGRQSVTGVEAAGGALVGAEIGATDTRVERIAGELDEVQARDDRARLQRELARADLPAAERAELRRQLDEATPRARAGDAAASTARAQAQETPMHFAYQPGAGTGVGARVSDAGRALSASTAATLGFTLSALAWLGPPALLILLLVVLWFRWGRRLWQRLLGTPAA
jgi:hypothetical protein